MLAFKVAPFSVGCAPGNEANEVQEEEEEVDVNAESNEEDVNACGLAIAVTRASAVVATAAAASVSVPAVGPVGSVMCIQGGGFTGLGI